ncbi:general transcription factor IIF subunit 1-like [Patiria miniata]|uniref:Uncharacterized protein n=1 Tax=Patiria miniata TaxID=46514 RepID=A0A914ASS2_PATMI|nr:general transcription factor IIF subunit 1-like [Patiria miniata]
MEEGQGRPRRKAKSRSLLRMMEMRDKDETMGDKSWDSSRKRKAKGDNLLGMETAHGEPTHCGVCFSTAILKFSPEEEEAGKDSAEQEEEADQVLIQETNPEEQGGKEPAEEEKEPDGDKEDKEKASRKTVKSTKKRKKPKISTAYERQKRKLKQKEMMQQINEKVKTSTSSSSKPKALKATGTAVVR